MHYIRFAFDHFLNLLPKLRYLGVEIIIIYNFRAFGAIYQGFLSDIDDSQDSRGREGTIFYSTLPLPPAHEHSDIYLQLCT